MHPVASVDTLKFVDLHQTGNTSKRRRPDGLHSNESLRQSQRVARQQDRARRCKRLHSLRDMRWDAVKAQVDEICPLVLDGNNERTGIDPNPDFKKNSELTPNFSGRIRDASCMSSAA